MEGKDLEKKLFNDNFSKGNRSGDSNLIEELEKREEKLKRKEKELEKAIEIMKRNAILVGRIIYIDEEEKRGLIEVNGSLYLGNLVEDSRDIRIGEYVKISSSRTQSGIQYNIFGGIGLNSSFIRSGIVNKIEKDNDYVRLFVSGRDGTRIYEIKKESIEELLKTNELESIKGKVVYTIPPYDIIAFIGEDEVRFREIEEKVSLNDIGGLKYVKEEIQKKIINIFEKQEISKELNIEIPKGILFYGPPGTGKSMMAKAIANLLKERFGFKKCLYISYQDLISSYLGESSHLINNLFEYAKKNSSSVIVFDDIDDIGYKREDLTDERRSAINELLRCMDNVKPGEVIVIATTNRVKDLDIALRRHGRFDVEIEFLLPTEEDIEEILKIYLKGLKTDFGINEISSQLYGYSGADIKRLVEEMKMNALSNARSIVTTEDFIVAKEKIIPSLLKPYLVERPNNSLEDVGGLKEVKEEVEKIIKYYANKEYRELYKEFDIGMKRGILFYGPPGTGKTLMAKVIAGETKSHFIYVRPSDIYSKWVGESEKAVREILETARRLGRCIIYIDEAESILSRRGEKIGDPVHDKVVNEFLGLVEGFINLGDVLIIYSTNRPDLLDEALLRAGRVDLKLEFKPPSYEERKEIFKIHLEKINGRYDKEGIDFDHLAKETEGMTGADIERICKDAAEIVIEEYVSRKRKEKIVTQSDLNRAINKYKKVEENAEHPVLFPFEKEEEQGEYGSSYKKDDREHSYIK